jgi:hypothetical protein
MLNIRIATIKFMRPHIWIAALCLVAAARIFFFTAAFPFFNNVDEHAHFDLIWKYSQGHRPTQGSEPFSAEAYRAMVLFGSPEYLRKPEQFRDSRFPLPVATWPAPYRAALLDRPLQNQPPNHEEYSPPLYYWLAGQWLRFGQTLGLQNAGLLYWTRFLNLPLYLALMGLVYIAGRRIFPPPSRLPACLLLMAAFIPQDVFYTLNSDVLSPVLGAGAFILLHHCVTATQTHWHVYATLGLTLALALLVKTANLPLLAMAAAAPVVAAWRKGWARPDSAMIVKLLILMACLAGPLLIWIMGNLAVTGDWSASRPKIEHLGWTVKSLADLYPHPIFTLSGLGYFLHHLLASFWRGELVWGLERITLSWLDCYYSASTLVCLVLSAFFGLRGFIQRRENGALVLSLVGVVAAVGFMAALSVLFDFHDCWYPSREKPFFVSGRLLLSVFLPILITYGYGLKRLLGLLHLEKFSLHVVLIMAALITLAELVINRPAYESLYNFFHIPLGAL